MKQYTRTQHPLSRPQHENILEWADPVLIRGPAVAVEMERIAVVEAYVRPDEQYVGLDGCSEEQQYEQDYLAGRGAEEGFQVHG